MLIVRNRYTCTSVPSIQWWQWITEHTRLHPGTLYFQSRRFIIIRTAFRLQRHTYTFLKLFSMILTVITILTIVSKQGTYHIEQQPHQLLSISTVLCGQSWWRHIEERCATLRSNRLQPYAWGNMYACALMKGDNTENAHNTSASKHQHIHLVEGR
jgi:hypothetical protein